MRSKPSFRCKIESFRAWGLSFWGPGSPVVQGLLASCTIEAKYRGSQIKKDTQGQISSDSSGFCQDLPLDSTHELVQPISSCCSGLKVSELENHRPEQTFCT